MYLYISVIIFTNISARAGYDTRSIFKRSLTGLNSEFSFSYTSCLTKAEEPSPPYYLPIAGGRIIGFIPFPRVLELCGGARGVMVIVVENDTATRVQILDETDCISHSTNTLGKGMNPIILPPAMGK